jgi:serine/threonine protein phosphatase PrpC
VISDDAELAISFRHGAATDPGLVRGSNEDALLVDPDTCLFVVADGLGGHRAGEVASRLAVERLHQCVSEVSAADEEPDQVLARALLEAHVVVRDAAGEKPELAGMGTTVVVAWIPIPDRMWVASVGDGETGSWSR